MKMKLLIAVAAVLTFSLTSALTCAHGVLDKSTGAPVTDFGEETCEEGVTVCHIQEYFPIRDGVEHHEEEWGCGPCVDGDLIAFCTELQG